MYKINIWKNRNRVYLLNPTYKQVSDILCGTKYKHIHYIMDINNFTTLKLRNTITKVITEELPKYLKSNNARVHFTLIRKSHIKRDTTNRYKDYIHHTCEQANISKGYYTVNTDLNFYIVRDDGMTYRILNVPNTVSAEYVVCKYASDKTDLIRIAGVQQESMVDGPGIRYVLFTQGCRHHCKGCHNPETHPGIGGYFVPIDDIVEDILKNPLYKGITLSGGEPCLQADAVVTLLCKLWVRSKLYNRKLDVMLYTGYTVEQLEDIINDVRYTDKGIPYLTHESWDLKQLYNRCNYIMDGKFNIKEASMECRWRGSKNQRMWELDVHSADNNGLHTRKEVYPVENK